LIKIIAHKTQVIKVIISGMAKPNLKIKYHTKKKTNHRPVKKMATPLVKIPKRQLLFFR
jgi:hypothetical protein